VIVLDFRFIPGLPELGKPCFVAWQPKLDARLTPITAANRGFSPMLGHILDLLIG
jgi:hypothetical protein